MDLARSRLAGLEFDGRNYWATYAFEEACTNSLPHLRNLKLEQSIGNLSVFLSDTDTELNGKE